MHFVYTLKTFEVTETYFKSNCQIFILKSTVLNEESFHKFL